jgi:nitric oxide reductase NorQ protein
LPKTNVDKIPCPHCPYEAFGQVDLDRHLEHAHGEKNHEEVARKLTEAAEKQTETPPEPSTPPAAAETPAPDTPEEKHDFPPGIFIPEPQPDFWVSDRIVNALYVVAKISKAGEPVNLKVLGPAGVGKTTLGWEFAAANKRPCFEVHWGMYQEPGEVWGKDRLSMERGTFYEQARYVDALETPYCVIVNDEPNRCHPEVLNTNFALWDWRRAAWVPDLKRMVRVAPGVVFFACMNEGSEYIGVNPMDRAIRERFTRTIRLTWPPMKVEAKILRNRTGISPEVADKLAKFAREVRRNPKVGCVPSTRQLLVAAQDVKEGLPLNEAVLYSIINDLDEGVDRTALLQHLQIIGGINEALVNGQQEDTDA